MNRGKWGESFLKSGLPLEHLTQVTFRSAGWSCSRQYEYARSDKEGVWFEVDLVASSPNFNKDTGLEVLVECKYHDLSRHWFFLPHDSQGRWCFDDRVLNCGPYQTLRNPRSNTFLPLAPQSSGGIVVSEDGTKQDNAVHTAIEQVVNAFVPRCLSHMFQYNIDFHNVITAEDELRFVPEATALIPMVVTNAKLYRLKPEITDLHVIRAAAEPKDIADEVPWTWCYHEAPSVLCHQNHAAIERHVVEQAELVYRFPHITDELYRFIDRPNWLAVVNISALSDTISTIEKQFVSLKSRAVEALIGQPKSRGGRKK